jgi:hypothetical protein
VFAGVVGGMTGAFYINPIAGDVAAMPGTVIGIILGLAFVVRDVPDLGDIEADNLPAPDLRAPPDPER